MVTQQQIQDWASRGTKHCSQCAARGASQTEWPTECFSRSVSTKDGFSSVCRNCARINTRTWQDKQRARNLAARVAEKETRIS